MLDIKLTDVERLILANQYEILSLLKPGQGYEHLARNLRDGHEWLYERAFESLSENMPQERVNFFLAIMTVYGDLKISYEHLTDKSGIDPNDLVFPGFNEDSEGDLLRLTEALCAEGRYAETLGREARRSRSRTTERYQRMIFCWEEHERERRGYPLSREAVLAILGK